MRRPSFLRRLGRYRPLGWRTPSTCSMSLGRHSADTSTATALLLGVVQHRSWWHRSWWQVVATRHQREWSRRRTGPGERNGCARLPLRRLGGADAARHSAGEATCAAGVEQIPPAEAHAARSPQRHLGRPRPPPPKGGRPRLRRSRRLGSWTLEASYATESEGRVAHIRLLCCAPAHGAHAWRWRKKTEVACRRSGTAVAHHWLHETRIHRVERASQAPGP